MSVQKISINSLVIPFTSGLFLFRSLSFDFPNSSSVNEASSFSLCSSLSFTIILRRSLFWALGDVWSFLQSLRQYVSILINFLYKYRHRSIFDQKYRIPFLFKFPSKKMANTDYRHIVRSSFLRDLHTHMAFHFLLVTYLSLSVVQNSCVYYQISGAHFGFL